MKLFETIDYLFVGTRYGCWAIGILGIAASLVLAVANLGMGFGAVFIFVSTLLLSIALTLLLAPRKLFEKRLSSKKRYIISGVCLAIALVVTGIVYFTSGGFPELNLLFI